MRTFHGKTHIHCSYWHVTVLTIPSWHILWLRIRNILLAISIVVYDNLTYVFVTYQNHQILYCIIHIILFLMNHNYIRWPNTCHMFDKVIHLSNCICFLAFLWAVVILRTLGNVWIVKPSADDANLFHVFDFMLLCLYHTEEFDNFYHLSITMASKNPIYLW